jgi:serine/threonine-protein kinase PknK
MRRLSSPRNCYAALIGGDAAHALACFESAVEGDDDPTVRVGAMMSVGWALEFRGDIKRALVWQEKALAIAESAGEVVLRSHGL